MLGVALAVDKRKLNRNTLAIPIIIAITVKLPRMVFNKYLQELSNRLHINDIRH